MSLTKLTTCLWFDTQAEEAAKHYISIFKNSKITHIQHYSDAGTAIHGHTPGTVMVVEFELAGHHFVGLNGGPHVTFNHAVSFMVDCKTQEEVDYYWEKLGEGGDPASHQCGWLADKFGVSWQIVPSVLLEMMASEDKEAAVRAENAMLNMKKMDIAALKKAFEG